MRHAVLERGLMDTAVATSASANEPKVSRNNIPVEHIRIDSDKPYGEAGAALEKLPKFEGSNSCPSALWRGRARQCRAEENPG